LISLKPSISLEKSSLGTSLKTDIT